MQPIRSESRRSHSSSELAKPHPRRASRAQSEKGPSWQTTAAAVGIGILRLTAGAAARAMPFDSSTTLMPAMPQGRALLQSSNALDSTVFAPLVAPAPRGSVAPAPAPVPVPAPAPAPVPAPAVAPLNAADAADYCGWLFTPEASADADVAAARRNLVGACRTRLGAKTEPLSYLERERAAGEAPGAGNFTQISVLAPEQGFANLTLTNHTFGGVLANITPGARAYVSPFWPRGQGPIDDGFIDAGLIRAQGTEISRNNTQSWFDWLFGQKLAHRGPLDDSFNATTDPDLIANIPGLSATISADSQGVSPGLALNRWLDTVNAAGVDAEVSPWPLGRAYNSTGDWASGTGPLLGDVTARPQLFVDRYWEVASLLTEAEVSRTSLNATLTAYRNIINYGLYNLGQPAL